MNPAGEPSPFLQFVPLIFLFGVFYFLLIRPQQKQKKEHSEMLAKLEKNDEVITSGGIHATVVSVGDSTASLRVADNVRIEVEKSSIGQVVKSKKA